MTNRRRPLLTGYAAVAWIALMGLVLAIGDQVANAGDFRVTLTVIGLGAPPAAVLIIGLLVPMRAVALSSVAIAAAGFWLLTLAGAGLVLLFGFAPSAILATVTWFRLNRTLGRLEY